MNLLVQILVARSINKQKYVLNHLYVTTTNTFQSEGVVKADLGGTGR